MHIPDYIAKDILRHFSIILENAKPDSKNMKYYNAVRLGKKDIKRISKWINNEYGQPAFKNQGP